MAEWIVTGLMPDGVTYPQMVVRSVGGRSGRADSLGRIGHALQFTIETYPSVFQELIWGALANGPKVFVGSVWDLGGNKRYIYCTDIDIREHPGDEGMGFWDATANFGPADPQLLGLSAIPLDVAEAPVAIDWGTWTEPFALYRDKDGNILQNTAGDRFNEPVEDERRFPLMTVRRKERSFDPAIAASYWDTVNASEWDVRGIAIPARYAKCVNITGNQQWHPTIGIFYDVTYEFAIRNQSWTDTLGTAGQGWDLNVQNTGFRQKVGSELKEVKDADGNLMGAPVPLDSGGVALAVPLSPSTVFPNITFRVRREVDFTSAFLFPTTMPAFPPADPTYV